MSRCDEYSVETLHYLDNGLRGQELDDFRSHLDSCANCRARVEAERALSQVLRRTRPLYPAPAGLRARVSALQHSTRIGTSAGLFERVLKMLESGVAEPARRVARVRVLVPALLVMGLVLAVVPNVVHRVRAANYVETAVTMHRSYLDGNLSLGFRSSSPELVAGWFTGKVPFQFRLPNAQFAPDSIPPYRLTGASVVGYRGSPAALVTYEKQKEKISLLIASAHSAAVAGGDEVHFGDLTFHYHTDRGFKVVTWTNHGLSYALVSSLSSSTRESCMVCHQNMADGSHFKVRQ